MSTFTCQPAFAHPDAWRGQMEGDLRLLRAKLMFIDWTINELSGKGCRIPLSFLEMVMMAHHNHGDIENALRNWGLAKAQSLIDLAETWFIWVESELEDVMKHSAALTPIETWFSGASRAKDATTRQSGAVVSQSIEEMASGARRQGLPRSSHPETMVHLPTPMATESAGTPPLCYKCAPEADEIVPLVRCGFQSPLLEPARVFVWEVPEPAPLTRQEQTQRYIDSQPELILEIPVSPFAQSKAEMEAPLSRLDAHSMVEA